MSDLESKEEGVNLGMEKPLTTEDMPVAERPLIGVQPHNPTEEQIDLIRKEIDNGMTKSPDGVVDHVDETTESEATTKFLRSSDAEFDASQLIFVNPDEGTPAAEALAANAALVVSKVTKGLHKFRVKRLTMKRLNIVKQLKKTSKGRQFSKNFKGKVIDGVHELYTLTAGMMLGIRCSVGRITLDSRDELVLEDFSHVEKMTFPASGSTKPGFITPPHSLAHTFKFKSYALQVFRRIRTFFGIDNAEYMMSICGSYNFLEFISNSKSGQFFFYSHDGKYMIKTQTKEENKFMKRVLPHYYKFVTENPHTMLVRILGMHRVKMYHLRRKVHFVIMTSVFDTPEKIHTVYDLKGSLIGRQATQKERQHGGVLKDMDLVIDNAKLQLGAKKAAFMVQIERDASFLAALNIMDYSLLVGIHDRKQRTPTHPADPSGEQEILGPHGQHSNTPFRRNRTGNTINPSMSKSLSAQSSPSSSYLRKSMNSPRPASTGFARYLDSSRELDVHEGEVDYATSIGADHTTQIRRNSLTRSVSKKDEVNDDEYDELALPLKAKIRTARARTLSSNETADIGLPIGSPQSASSPSPHRNKLSPKRRSHNEGEGDPTTEEAAGLGTPRLGSPNGGALWSGVGSPNLGGVGSAGLGSPSGGEEGYDDDDYDYSVDEDDIELDVDLTTLGLKDELEVETEEEDHYDDGDSDVDTSAVSDKNPPIPSQHHDSNSDDANTPHTRRECEDEGKGLKGIEGQQLAPMLRLSAGGLPGAIVGILPKRSKSIQSPGKGNSAAHSARNSCSSACEAMATAGKDSMVTFGPGASQNHPWTLRKDSGINSRRQDGSRGDAIYYIGVIDILQQYNMRKRAETFIKSLSNDSRQISSVDSVSYAKRFVKFIDDNII